MRFEVPQFIEVEDKIFGPFTWKQFIYLAGGGGTLVVLFLTTPLIVFAFIGIPIAALAGFLAFHQINNRPFSIFLESAVGYFTKNRLYLWRKQNPQTVTSKVEALPETPAPVEPAHIPTPETNNIASLSRKLEMEAIQDEIKKQAQNIEK